MPCYIHTIQAYVGCTRECTFGRTRTDTCGHAYTLLCVVMLAAHFCELLSLLDVSFSFVNAGNTLSSNSTGK